jgi:hypothetical protein
MMPPSDLTRLDAQLLRLQLHYFQSHCQPMATKAAEQQLSHLDYLAQLVEGEAAMRENRSIKVDPIGRTTGPGFLVGSSAVPFS